MESSGGKVGSSGSASGKSWVSIKSIGGKLLNLKRTDLSWYSTSKLRSSLTMAVCAYSHYQKHEISGQGCLLTEHLRALIPHGTVQRGLGMSVCARTAPKERNPQIMELRAHIGQQAYLPFHPLGEINPIWGGDGNVPKSLPLKCEQYLWEISP